MRVAGGGVVPELIGTQGKTAGQFDGAMPMVGFGAGAMALWLGGEMWGDDLSACLNPPTLADDLQVAEPTPDAGSAADAEIAQSDAVDSADDATAATVDVDAAVADAPADFAIPVDTEADDDAAQAAAPRASGCQAGGATRSVGLALALACAILVRRRRV